MNNHEMFSLNEQTEGIVPKQIFINLEPRFASLILTAPNPNIDLPENPSLSIKDGFVVVTIENNNRWKLDSEYPTKLFIDSGSPNKSEIKTVSIDGHDYTFGQVVENKEELLKQYFISILGSEEAVSEVRKTNELSGLQKESYLYRAISNSELKKLKLEQSKWVSHLDPSANFENQAMYEKDSQAKMFKDDKENDYAGLILRWKIEDPLFYRKAGFNPQRVVPLFTHYLPKDLEISEDGENFVSIQEFFDQQK